MVKLMHLIFQHIWEKGKVPQDWRDTILVSLFKKCRKDLCNNYRGISFLSDYRKLSTPQPSVQVYCPHGFPGVSMWFPTKQRDNGYYLYCTTVAGKVSKATSGLVSVFYWPNKGKVGEALWTILLKFGCPESGEGSVSVETEVK